jgi:hypothetical protein
LQTAISNPAISEVVWPSGTYTPDEGITVARGNLTITDNGCTFYIPLASLAATNHRVFNVYSPPLVSVDTGPGWARYGYHCTGIISADTQTVRMMEAPDPLPVAGDKWVYAHGVEPGDMINPYAVIFVTIASVVGEYVSFVDPIGVDIPHWDTEEDLQAVAGPFVDPEKAGVFGTDEGWGNFCKGYGEDGQLIPYQSGYVENLVIHVPRIEFEDIDASSGDDIPDGGAVVWVEYVKDVTIHIPYLRNSIGSVVHIHYCDNVTIYVGEITGFGASKIFASDMNTAPLLSMWGGSNIHMIGGTVTGTNFIPLATEIRPRNVTLEGFTFDIDYVEVDADPPYTALSVYYDCDNLVIKNCTWIKAAYIDGASSGVITFDNVVFAGGLLSGYGYYTFRHTILTVLTISSTTWGPVDDSKVASFPIDGDCHITFPTGLYRTGTRFRLTDVGDVTHVGDVFGNNLTAAALTGEWVDLVTLYPTNWGAYQETPYPFGGTYPQGCELIIEADGIDSGTIQLECVYNPDIDSVNHTFTVV